MVEGWLFGFSAYNYSEENDAGDDFEQETEAVEYRAHGPMWETLSWSFNVKSRALGSTGNI